MKVKKLKTTKGNTPKMLSEKVAMSVPVKTPIVPHGYEIAGIEIVFKKVNAVNPNPGTLRKATAAVKKVVPKAVVKKVAKKVVAKKVVAPKKVVKKK